MCNGLDIIELRAVWHCLPTWDGLERAGGAEGNAKNSLEIGKSEWKDGLKAKLDDMNYKEAKGTLSKSLIRNEAYLVTNLSQVPFSKTNAIYFRVMRIFMFSMNILN
jgi:hypothetical protein